MAVSAAPWPQSPASDEAEKSQMTKTLEEGRREPRGVQVNQCPVQETFVVRARVSRAAVHRARGPFVKPHARRHRDGAAEADPHQDGRDALGKRDRAAPPLALAKITRCGELKLAEFARSMMKVGRSLHEEGQLKESTRLFGLLR